MGQTVLILGASFAGLKIAHKLLKTTLPAVPDLKVILVNTSTHVYWNLASVRAIIPDAFPEEKVFGEIAPGFEQYPAENFEFVIGTAKESDVDKKTVGVQTESGLRQISYDTLVVATGASAADEVPWKGQTTYEKTLDSLHEVQAKVGKATDIVVGGSGPTGVETAGELAAAGKNVTLITNASVVLSGTSVPEKIAKNAEKQLVKMGVKIIHETKVTGYNVVGSGKTEVTISPGSTITTDLYLPTTGVRPNTDFLPKKFLDSSGKVQVDEYLRVKGTTNIWSAGDANDLEGQQMVYTDAQATHLSKNVDLVLRGSEAVVYKPGPTVMAVTIGPGMFTAKGHMSGWSLPAIMVYMLKGKTFGTENMNKLIFGA